MSSVWWRSVPTRRVLPRCSTAFKELDSIPQFKATAKLGEFLEARFLQSF
jgi:hypothetical protein